MVRSKAAIRNQRAGGSWSAAQRSRARSSAATLLAMACALGSFCTTGYAADKRPAHVPDAEHGRRLFERVWQVGNSPTNDRDGLGPVFNERSCVACHDRGGVGGGGLNSKNVELIAVAVPKNLAPEIDVRNPILARVPGSSPELAKLRRRVGMLHSDLYVAAGTMLHTFGTDPRYARFREQLLNLPPVKPAPATKQLTKNVVAARDDRQTPEARRLPDDQPVRAIELGDVTLLLTRRNSSAMFGSALIDTITPAELEAVAVEQRKRGDGISGRVVGRFGWRGQTPDLASFVRGACVAELGLEVAGESPAANPVKSTLEYRNNPDAFSPSTDRKSAEGVHDLSTAHVADLLHFVSSLPAPTRRLPPDPQAAAAVVAGEALFQATGCAVCHRPNMGRAVGVYSDLLAHDMGPGLEDPQPGPNSRSTMERVVVPDVPVLVNSGPIITEQDRESLIRVRSYYPVEDYVIVPPSETVVVDTVDRKREWRTAPLWGVADSAPYLHDGRAATLNEAIRLHGGEAAKSVEAYLSLSPEEREQLLAFLSSLVAPAPLPPLPPEVEADKTASASP